VAQINRRAVKKQLRLGAQRLHHPSTRLFNTVNDQFAALQARPSKHIKAIVVLTDGNDTVNQMTLDQLIARLSPASSDRNTGEGVKIFTIAYGGDADVNALTKIANTTGGQEYAGNPQNIRQVYQQISQFF
jgi:Ca-activated chloride channel homolog